MIIYLVSFEFATSYQKIKVWRMSRNLIVVLCKLGKTSSILRAHSGQTQRARVRVTAVNITRQTDLDSLIICWQHYYEFDNLLAH